MVTNEKIFFFHELVCCNYDMLLWVYDPEFHVEYSSADFKDMISTMSFQPAIEKHLASGIYTPLVLEAKIGLVWIVGFEHKDGRLKGIYLLGPSFTGRDTPMTLLKKMDNYGLSVKMRSTVTKTVSEVPVLPTNILSNYATMLHYTLNKEKISFNDISYSVPAHNKNFNSLDMVPDEHNGIWLNEQKFCSLIADGDPNYMDALAKSFSLSSGIKADSGIDRTAGNQRLHPADAYHPPENIRYDAVSADSRIHKCCAEELSSPYIFLSSSPRRPSYAAAHLPFG